MPAKGGDSGAPQGLSWSWELDFDSLVRGLSEAGLGDVDDPHSPDCPDDPHISDRLDDPRSPDSSDIPDSSDNPDDLDALDGPDGERLGAGVLAGRVAERLAPGPDLVGLLAAAPARALGDADLAAVAGSWRRVAAWAQAQELAAVAQIASRTAARDEDIGTDADGRPARIPVSAAAEVALELTMSQYGAAWWADLAVQLSWRLAATGAALAAGVIDLTRARLIAEATGRLSDEAARVVEDKVLPVAGGQTTGMLRAALRRAVIAADPQGAERRREEAERQAKVSLYPDEETTATLAGQRLPGVHAAAAMARIKAMARAWKASGASGPMDLLCAKIYLGLLLGTLPLIPPAEGARPDIPSGDGPGDAGQDASGDGPDGRIPPGDGVPGAGVPDDDEAGAGVPDDDVPPPGDADAPRDDYPCPDKSQNWSGSNNPDMDDGDDGLLASGPVPAWPDLPAVIPAALARPADGRPAPGLLDLSVRWQVLAGASEGPGHLGRIGPVTAAQARQLAGCAARDPGAEWRIILTGAAGQAIAVTRIPRRAGRPPPAGRPGTPGRGHGRGLVGRVTVIIPEDLLAHPPPPEPPPAPAPAPEPGTGAVPGRGTGARAGPGPGTGAGAGTGPGPGRGAGAGTGPGPGSGAGAGPGAGAGSGAGAGGWPGPLVHIVRQARRAAARAAARARAAAAADAAAGGCAHTLASPGYRPSPRLRDHITARDLTCRHPRCRQPAWRADLDHTIPFDDGGLTCSCNLGAFCRTHHLLKHHPGWKVRQTAPGTFTWTTPSGRTFTTTPDTHPT